MRDDQHLADNEDVSLLMLAPAPYVRAGLATNPGFNDSADASEADENGVTNGGAFARYGGFEGRRSVPRPGPSRPGSGQVAATSLAIWGGAVSHPTIWPGVISSLITPSYTRSTQYDRNPSGAAESLVV